MTFHVPEKHRAIHPLYPSSSVSGNNGFFIVPAGGLVKLNCIASDGMGWEHVSVSIRNAGRVPTWHEMCLVKGLFWDDYDCCVQFHPPKKDYVNDHPGCLHIWRPTLPFPMPSIELV
jgi:hypothetical protein